MNFEWMHFLTLALALECKDQDNCVKCCMFHILRQGKIFYKFQVSFAI